ncbi:hypothetical protein J1614_005630 [Plenodomus biglobosus]|nr:hypothetical protein J1614_005630 [Plenodomus biglobosus]
MSFSSRLRYQYSRATTISFKATLANSKYSRSLEISVLLIHYGPHFSLNFYLRNKPIHLILLLNMPPFEMLYARYQDAIMYVATTGSYCEEILYIPHTLRFFTIDGDPNQLFRQALRLLVAPLHAFITIPFWEIVSDRCCLHFIVLFWLGIIIGRNFF